MERYKSFFMEAFLKDLWKSIKSISVLLKKYNIKFMFIGGSALNQYSYNRTTQDVDILIAKEDREKMLNLPIGFIKDLSNGRGKRFKLHNPETDIDIIYEGEISGDGKKGLPFKINDVNTIKGEPFISLSKLIEYKISSGLYGNRFKDYGDVQALIKNNNLSKNFGDKFRKDLKEKYMELWIVTQNEKEI